MRLPTYGDNIRLAPLRLELGLELRPKSNTTYLLVLVLGHLQAAAVTRKSGSGGIDNQQTDTLRYNLLR